MSSSFRLLRALAQSHQRWLGLLGVAALLGAVAVILQMENLSRIIDGAFIGRVDLMRLREPFLWFAGAVGLRSGALWLSELAGQELAACVKEQLRNRLLRSLTRRGPLFTQREKTGELAACSVEGVEKLDAWYAKFLPHSLAVAIVPATLALFVLWIDWPSGIVLVLTGPLIPIFMALIGMIAQGKTQEQWAALSQMSGHFLDVLQGLPTLHLFGRSGVQGANISRVSEYFRQTTMQVLRIAFLSGLVLELAASISTAMVAVEIGVRLIEGLIDFRTGLFVLLLAPEFYLPFRQLGASHHAGMEGAAAAERIFELLENPLGESSTEHGNNEPAQEPAVAAPCRGLAGAPQLEERRRPEDLQIRPSCGGPQERQNDKLSGPIHIQFENVDYQYPGAPALAICGLTFDLTPGRIHLLVGQSGAGKSTVMKLLLRFMQPTGGALMVNGRPLWEIPPELWRNQVAFVSQHPHFFEGSVFDNLRAARPGAALDQVRAAAQHAQADEFVMALPQKYHTPISERATRFSGGERQRLAIARAFLKNSPLLLFDEPTSHVDAETATKLQSAFLDLAAHRTVLVVAHHGFAFGGVDVEFVLSRGRLAKSIERLAFTHPTNARTHFETMNPEVRKP